MLVGSSARRVFATRRASTRSEAGQVAPAPLARSLCLGATPQTAQQPRARKPQMFPTTSSRISLAPLDSTRGSGFSARQSLGNTRWREPAHWSCVPHLTTMGPGVERSRSAVGSSWSGGVELAVGTGIAYFLAGRLGLLLRAESDMAVFWPASGIAVGALIALGPRVRLPLAVSVFLGAIASSVSIGRNLGLSFAFGA